jgi:hypothetical protein
MATDNGQDPSDPVLALVRVDLHTGRLVSRCDPYGFILRLDRVICKVFCEKIFPFLALQHG